MACGCSGGGNQGMRATQSVRPDSVGVLASVTTQTNHHPHVKPISEERKKIEQLRRDAILRALSIPG